MFTLEFLQALANAVSVLGLPIAIVAFVVERTRDRRSRELAAFAVLDDKYIDYLRLCLEYPKLDVHAAPQRNPVELTEAEARQEYALFAILISLFESVFVMLEGHEPEYRNRTWPGWEACMKSYARRPGFVEAWRIVGPQCDRQFSTFMQNLVRPPAPAT